MSSAKPLTGLQIFTFGPYRLRARERVLEQNGAPVAIPAKTLELLCVLVKNAGQLVEKRTLMDEVWPGTFVDDSNLAFQISTLRKLFDESATSPKYITTVPKRGYRFIAEISEESDSSPARDALEPPRPPVKQPSIAPPANAVAAIPSVRSFNWSKLGIASAICLVLVLGWILMARPDAQTIAALSEKGAIVLADFDNKTGDPVFDGTLRQGLIVELEQSPSLSLLPEHRLRRTLALMRQPPTAPLTHDTSMAICQRTGSALLIEGSLERVGSVYVLGLRAWNCDTGALVDAAQAKAQDKERVLDVLGAMSVRFRSRLGEAAASLSRHHASLAEATTASAEALKAYTTAWSLHATRGSAEAIPLFRHAVELDPSFAIAYSALGRMYADIDQSDLSAESLRKAWDLKEHASDRERFFIATNYFSLANGNLQEARQVAESWAQTYPRDALPHTMLSGLPNKILGRFEEAVSQAAKAIEIDPDFGISYYNLAVNNLYLQRLDAASRALEAASTRGLDIEEFHMLAYDLAFIRQDTAAMDRIVEQTRRRSGLVSWLTNKEAFRMAYAGHVRRARELSARAISEAEQVNERERAGLWEAGAALREAMTGNLLEARKKADAALRRTNDREVAYGAGLALALSGDWSRAQSIADQLEARFPQDTSVRFTYVPVMRAAIHLSRHKPDAALQALEPARPTEISVSRSPVNSLYGALYPIYFRGLALSAQGRGIEAAAEFRRIIEHSGIVVYDPVGSLAHLQLARSYRKSGDIDKTKTAYQSFFALWKDADPEIPLLRDARAEYKNLLARPSE